ncbi:hypothetical protein G6F31_019273 [Rhizopus arrhizus]|nr:hypothetical protein G6F31_019273 [Rhizopus arrhizus]
MARAKSVIDGVPARAMWIRMECCETFKPQGASTVSYNCDTRRVALRSAAPLQTRGSGTMAGTEESAADMAAGTASWEGQGHYATAGPGSRPAQS